MKRLALLLVCVATFAFTACGTLQQAGSSEAAAQAVGQSCGSALVGLYQSYRSTGSLNLGTGNNLVNALTLATCYSQVRQHKNSQTYRKGFTKGFIVNGAGLIPNQNASIIVNALLAANGITSISKSNSVAQNNTCANNTIIPILNAMK